MKIFLDVFTGDELCSDSYPMKVVDDVYYEVEGKVRRFIGEEKQKPRSNVESFRISLKKKRYR